MSHSLLKMTRGLSALASLFAMQAVAPDALCDEPWHAGVGGEAFASHDTLGMAATATLLAPIGSRVSIGLAASYGVLTDTSWGCFEGSTAAGETTADGSDCQAPTVTPFHLMAELRAYSAGDRPVRPWFALDAGFGDQRTTYPTNPSSIAWGWAAGVAVGMDIRLTRAVGLELALRALVVDLPEYGSVSQPAFAQPFVSLGLGPYFDLGL